MEVLKYVLRLGIRFVDTWKPQLESIRSFLTQKGLAMGRVSSDKGRTGNRQTAYRLDVGETASVIRLMRALVGLCVKKRQDLAIALDYLEDRITGDEAVAKFNEQHTSGRRRGTTHSAEMPYTRSQGLKLYELTNAKKAWEAHTVKVDRVVMDEIREDDQAGWLGVRRLSRKYGYSQGVLRRILREPKD